MADLNNPHDRFFKEVFSRPEVASDFIRTHLPEDVAARLDLDSLQLQKDSFIDQDLQQHFSDMLYQVALTDGDAAYVYVLFEHKSYPEPLIAFQLLRYMVRIWDQFLRESDRIPEKRALPPIIPIVVYHGRTTWSVPLELDALFQKDEVLREYVPSFRYELRDLSTYSDEQIQGTVLLQVTLLLLKHIFHPDLGERLPTILATLRELTRPQSALQYVETALRYLSSANDNLTHDDLRRAIETIAPSEGDNIVTTLAKQWMEEGLEQGLRSGLQDSIHQGVEIKFGTQGVAILAELGISELNDVELLRAINRELFLSDSVETFQRNCQRVLHQE